MNAKRAIPTSRGGFLLFAAALLFAAITAIFQPALAIVEGICCIGLFFVLRTLESKRSRALLDYMLSRDHDIETATRGTIVNAALPMVIFEPESGEIIWSNKRFLSICGSQDHLFDTNISEAAPDFGYRWLTEGENSAPAPVQLGKKSYLVFGNLIDGKLGICYWVDITNYANVEARFASTRPIVAILMIDNYDEMLRGLEESERSLLLSELHKKISHWAEPTGGILSRYDREHYLLIFEEAHYEELRRARFSLLEQVRTVRASNQIAATLSIGMARGEEGLRELFRHAKVASEMALSRGGDQAVLRDGEQFLFFGGKAKETERRTKLKSRIVSNALGELLDNSSRVFLMGHSFPDLDVSGAQVALAAIARAKGLPFHLIREPGSAPCDQMYERLARLPEYEDAFLTGEDARLLVDERSLLIVVDTNRPEQVAAQALLRDCPRVVIVDHHRRAASYIENPVLSFEDPYASSASELGVELMQHLLPAGALGKQEAEAVLAGIVLDTKNFSLRTGSRTFEAAAYLRRTGADTAEVSRLFRAEWSEAIARYDIVRRAVLYRPGLSIAITELQTDRVTAAKAADEMIAIAEIHSSFVLCPGEAEAINLSARSVGIVNVQLICEALGGGGNAAAAGAQIVGLSLQEAEQRLHAAIASYFEDEKD